MLVSESIYHTEKLGYIDLSKIVEISNAYFLNRMGCGGFYIGFDILYQLVDKRKYYEKSHPMTLERQTAWETYSDWEIMSEKDGWVKVQDYKAGQKKLAVVMLQEEIDDLVDAWITYKGDTKCQS